MGFDEEDLERERYEEDNMIRLMLTKKDKQKQKKNKLKNEFDVSG